MDPAVRSRKVPYCPKCREPLADPDEPCQPCARELTALCERDRIAEFYDSQRNVLFVRLRQERSEWVTFVEHSVPGLKVRVGMREEFPERELACERFVELVRSTLAAGWHPVRIVMRDKRFVDPLQLGGL
jgi:hypothetical protein